MWMRMQCALVLFLGMFLLQVGVLRAFTTGKPTSNQILPHELVASKSTTPARFLRSDDTFDAKEEDEVNSSDDEERVNIPGLSKVAELASMVHSESAQTLARKAWLSSGKSPEKVFAKLKLGKAGANLEDNPKLLEWLRSTNAYKQKNGARSFPDNKVFAILADNMPGPSMPRFFQSLQEIPELKKLGEDLYYVATKEPAGVFKTMGLDEAGTKLSTENPKLLQWLRFTNQYIMDKGTAQFYSEQITATLSTKMTNAELAGFYHSLKGVSDLEELGKELQHLQFSKWIGDGIEPRAIESFLGDAKVSSEIMADYLSQYTTALLAPFEAAKRMYLYDDPGAVLKAALTAYEKSKNT